MADILIRRWQPNGNPFLGRAELDENIEHEWQAWGEGRETETHLRPKVREEEIQAILRGLQESHKSVRNYDDLFYQSNKRLVYFGVVLIFALVAAISFYKAQMSSIVYGLPVILAFVYGILIVIVEFRFGLSTRR